ncbi:hypothetical protein N6H18_00060 [Reichenbachiella agarivorans]|uniref:AhpC/TSA family protein n=1 Tax=Reichenbachiella agarivorans TaxID=2979464 RepID=A0ABY6CSL8_9BACT|nr:hypothetical protein [Reichenbachiella agarivorans]UXP32368.1 hypothetical protein N6H18_00060 [Reichenbachiella agarivorans]
MGMIGVLSLIFFLIMFLFWSEEYSHLQAKNSDVHYDVNNSPMINQLGVHIQEKPVYIHFFDPTCKYSRVNIEHLKGLFQSYTEQIDFYLVVRGGYDAIDQDLIARYDLPLSMTVVVDETGDLFALCGVSSTPRAVIFNPNSTLFFEGNYTNGFAFCGASNIKSSAPAVALQFKSKNYQAPLSPVVSGFSCALSI